MHTLTSPVRVPRGGDRYLRVVEILFLINPYLPLN